MPAAVRAGTEGRGGYACTPATWLCPASRHFSLLHQRAFHAGKLRIIAEPGRYFAEAFATYACFINGWRARSVGEAAEQHFDYFITDGLYGSMNW